MASDNILLGIIQGAQQGADLFLQDYLAERRQNRLSQNEFNLFKQKLPLEEASKIRIEQAKPSQPTYLINPQTGQQVGSPIKGKAAVLPPPTYIIDPTTGEQMGSVSGKTAILPRVNEKLQKEKPKALGALSNTIREYDNMINEANSIKNDPDLSSIALTGSIPFTGGKRVAARLDTLKSKTLLNVLSAMKQLSATGASGFGQLSDTEGKEISNSVSTLDRYLKPQDLKDSLDRFTNEMRARKENLLSTYENTYGESPNISSNSDLGYTPAQLKKMKDLGINP